MFHPEIEETAEVHQHDSAAFLGARFIFGVFREASGRDEQTDVDIRYGFISARNVYRDLKFPEHVYEHIQEFYKQRS